MAKQRGGFVVIHRTIWEHPDLRDFADATAFVWLISHAAWSPMKVRYKGAEIILERGQIAVSVRDFAKAIDRPAAWVQRLFARLEKSGMITRCTPRYTSDTSTDTPPAVITICNYSKYQDIPDRADTPTDTPSDTPSDTQKNKENHKNQRKKEPPTPFDLPEWVPQRAWQDWLSMRKENKKPASASAQRLALKKLTEFRKRGEDPGLILDQSTLNGWTGLYPGRNGETKRRDFIGGV